MACFLELLTGLTGCGNLLNCMDCAVAVTVFARLIGVDATVIELTENSVGPSTGTFELSMNPVVGLGWAGSP